MKTIQTILYTLAILVIPVTAFVVVPVVPSLISDEATLQVTEVNAQWFDYGDYSGIGDSYDYSYSDYSSVSSYFDYADYSGVGDSYNYADSYNGSFYDYSYDDYSGIGDSYSYTDLYNGSFYDYGYDDYSGIGDAYDYTTQSYDYNYDDYSGIGDAYDYGDLYNGNYSEADAGGDWYYDETDAAGDAFNGEQDAGGDFNWNNEADAGGDWYYDEADAGGDYLAYNDVDAGGDYYYPEFENAPNYYDDNYFYPTYDTGYYAYPYDSNYYYPNQSTAYYPTYTNPSYSYNYPDYVDDNDANRPTCVLTASDNSIDKNDSVRLTWTTRYATSASFNNGIGSVAGSGSRTVSPRGTETYTLTVRGPGGTVTCSETIRVDQDNDDDNVRCDSFTASDTTVDEGDRVTLSWRTTGADDVRINNGIGSVNDDGREQIRINDDITFTLTARNGNDTDTCRVTIRVDEDDKKNRNDNDKDAPRCVFNVSDKIVYRGQSIVLSWNNERTDRLTLKDDSRTLLDSGDRNVNEDRGSYTVRATDSTTYTLTVWNGNTRRTCELDVNVTDVKGGISLSQVPYTGFDAGPTLTALFYLAIALWGIFLAYVLVFKKDVKKKPEHLVLAAEAVIPEEFKMSGEMVEDTVPGNLPVMEIEETQSVDTDTLPALEARANEQYALISSDALRFIASQNADVAMQTATLDRVIALVKAKYPKEGEWIVINKERVLSVLG